MAFPKFRWPFGMARTLAAAAVCSASISFAPLAHATYTFQTLPFNVESLPGFRGAKLLAVSNRLLYGTMSGGGLNGGGTVFRLANYASQWHFKVIYNFCAQAGCADGAYPNGPVIVDTAGNLYGTAVAGGQASDKGVVFKLTPSGSLWRYRVLYNFCLTYSTCPDGRNPISGLAYQGQQVGDAYDGVSPLYGVTQSGGLQSNNGYGTVFTLSPSANGTWYGRAIYRFCQLTGCVDGYRPSGKVSIDSGGNLIGVTSFGGQAGDGVIYKLSPPASGREWNVTSLYSFCALAGCADGSSPSGPLTIDDSGNVFGTTQSGGAYGGGTVYRLAQNDSETVLHSFCAKRSSTGYCVDGRYPDSGVLAVPNGAFLGTTFEGGADNHDGGTLFRLGASGTFTILHHFCLHFPCNDGTGPSGLTHISGGRFLGTTEYGQNYFGDGRVFVLTRQ